jgi:hypothetical protein
MVSPHLRGIVFTDKNILLQNVVLSCSMLSNSVIFTPDARWFLHAPEIVNTPKRVNFDLNWSTFYSFKFTV